ncbi:Hypothetical_protein [Hexamita inflata]|uniref:Hypothetical_protein n=1 Tax=Hexamita inflata TaxID=28002 RepID=A0AA86QYV3_9EUKA|nr:Hypothetical protein HINF_LOCUS53487 [Hexamita inflata]
MLNQLDMQTIFNTNTLIVNSLVEFGEILQFIQPQKLVKQQIETDTILQQRSVPNQDNQRLHHCSSLCLKSTVKIAVHFSIVKITVFIMLYLLQLLNMIITGYRPVP